MKLEIIKIPRKIAHGLKLNNTLLNNHESKEKSPRKLENISKAILNCTGGTIYR
jgi:hypothetical protein